MPVVSPSVTFATAGAGAGPGDDSITAPGRSDAATTSPRSPFGAATGALSPVAAAPTSGGAAPPWSEGAPDGTVGETEVGAEAGAGVDSGAVVLAGRNARGSRYPSGLDASRIPSWTNGLGCSAAPLAPAVASAAPSVTSSPLRTPMLPRCESVTEKPSAVRIETVFPRAGTNPANVTRPVAGARTASPSVAAMSTPRCWPVAYGSDPTSKPRNTAPSTGHDQAKPASGTARPASSSPRTRARRIFNLLFSRRATRERKSSGWVGRRRT